jgi:hypothetical protein
MVPSIPLLPSFDSSLPMDSNPVDQRCSTHHFEGFPTVLSVLIDDEGDVDGWMKGLDDDFARSLLVVPTNTIDNTPVCSVVTKRCCR